MPLREWIAKSMFSQSIAASLLSILASIAFVLAAIGLYGVVAHAVTQRTQEFGVRLSLGAQRRDVLQMIMRQGLTVAMVGTAIGATLALLLGRVLKAFLVGLSPVDPLTYFAAAACVALLAVAATAVPAWRAMCIDPVRALRHE
jgi:putative ABC transport system permease protein